MMTVVRLAAPIGTAVYAGNNVPALSTVCPLASTSQTRMAALAIAAVPSADAAVSCSALARNSRRVEGGESLSSIQPGHIPPPAACSSHARSLSAGAPGVQEYEAKM